MEEETQYFTTMTNPSNLDGEVTILVDENGEMILDLTQALSNVQHHEEAGNLVIIAADQCETSTNLQNQITSSTENHQNCMDEHVDTLLTTVASSEETNISDNQIPEQLTSQTHNGQTLYVIQSRVETSSQPSTVPSIHDPNQITQEKPSVRRILPKPSSNASESPSHFRKRQKGAGLSDKTINYEICLWNENSIAPPEEDSNGVSKPFICEKCKSVNESTRFRRFEDLARHYIRIHRMRLLKHASVICKEDDCSFKSCRIGELRRHLTLAHGIPMDSKTHEFNSMEEFKTWMSEEEKSSGSKFNRSSGDHSVAHRRLGSSLCVYIYYTCHRSGTQRAQTTNEGTKKKKMQQSIKMNGTCTASINLIHDKVANKIFCEYYPTHYGHDTNHACRQNLSKQEKEWILQLLQRGWNSDEIVKTLRNGTINGTTVRMRRVTRQDVYNVCRSHGVKSFERRDPDDHRSLKLWVEELRSKSSVLVWNNSDESGLLLVVMSESQALLAGLHARIVYVSDTLLAWERYHRLITISALSSTDANAYLLAYSITDQKGVDALQAVFAAIQAKLGSFQPEFIFAQDPTTVAETWISDAESFPVFLYPSWKVEKEWNEGLVKYVVDDAQRDALQKMLDLLLSEHDPCKFSAFLQLVNGVLTSDENLLAFSRFFTSSYAGLAPHWARFHSLPDCTPLEQLIVELELIARRSRALKRLDKCIYSLEFIAANQPYEPMTEFRSCRNQHESDEMCNLRQSVTDRLKTLEQTVRNCNSLDALHRIDKVITEALQ